MRRRRQSIWALVTLCVVLQARSGRAQVTAEDVGYSAVAVALPVVDSVVFVGGVTSALLATVHRAEGRPSAAVRTANFVFAGLNAASTVGYIAAMGSVRGAWPYLLWPMLAHAGLSVANGILGAKLRPQPGMVARRTLPGPAGGVTVGPLVAWSPQHGTTLGLLAQVPLF